MRILAAGVLGLLLAGCSAFDRPEIKRCEERLLRTLRAPSTYKPVKKESIRIDNAKTRYQSVSIEYDAQNAFGTPLRETAFCPFPISGNDIREDLLRDTGDEMRDALDGKGYYSPSAKLPTRSEAQAELEARVNNIMNEAN